MGLICMSNSNMDMLYYTNVNWEQYFHHVKQRADDTVKVMYKPEYEDLIDEACRPLIKWFNQFTNVATIYCCSGHVDEETGGSPGYISLLFKDTNAENSAMRLLRVAMCKGRECKIPFEIELGAYFGHLHETIDQNHWVANLVIRTNSYKRKNTYDRYWHRLYNIITTCNTEGLYTV
ncbi:hypothetical protein KEN49_CDS0066 [Pseudomonas phage vB_Pae3705-KEN49]